VWRSKALFLKRNRVGTNTSQNEDHLLVGVKVGISINIKSGIKSSTRLGTNNKKVGIKT
jgi:hypothetical protein